MSSMLGDVVYSESVKCVKTYLYSLFNILIFRNIYFSSDMLSTFFALNLKIIALLTVIMTQSRMLMHVVTKCGCICRCGYWCGCRLVYFLHSNNILVVRPKHQSTGLFVVLPAGDQFRKTSEVRKWTNEYTYDTWVMKDHMKWRWQMENMAPVQLFAIFLLILPHSSHKNQFLCR